MKLYKLTEKDNTTKNNMKWKIGNKNIVRKCSNPELCSGDVIHAYKDLNFGLLMNPRHANIDNPNIYECKGKVVVEDWDKVGVFELTPIKKLKTPAWYKDEETRKRVYIRFAILCAEAVLPIWNEKYPEDARPRNAIEAAKKYLKTGKIDAASAAAADYAAANTAAYAANAAYAADAAYAAANAAANAAYRSNKEIDFIKLANEAIEIDGK